MSGTLNGFGPRVHARRKELGITLRELGRKSSLTAAFLCDLEHGRRSCSIDNAVRICGILGMKIDGIETPKDSVLELARAARTIAKWLEWDLEVLSDFHTYAQQFGGPANAGGNVFAFALRDALAYRGITLEQFRAEARDA